MENNEKTTQGDHPQVPTPKPPDRDDQGNSQPSEESPNEEIPLNEAEVLTEAMSEGSSEDEMPMLNALEQQPLATTKNGVSLPIKSASDPGGDHVGTADGGPGVISRDHVGTADRGPGDTVPPPQPLTKCPGKTRNRETSTNKRPKYPKDTLTNKCPS